MTEEDLKRLIEFMGYLKDNYKDLMFIGALRYEKKENCSVIIYTIGAKTKGIHGNGDSIQISFKSDYVNNNIIGRSYKKLRGLYYHNWYSLLRVLENNPINLNELDIKRSYCKYEFNLLSDSDKEFIRKIANTRFVDGKVKKKKIRKVRKKIKLFKKISNYFLSIRVVRDFVSFREIIKILGKIKDNYEDLKFSSSLFTDHYAESIFYTQSINPYIQIQFERDKINGIDLNFGFFKRRIYQKKWNYLYKTIPPKSLFDSKNVYNFKPGSKLSEIDKKFLDKWGIVTKE